MEPRLYIPASAHFTIQCLEWSRRDWLVLDVTTILINASTTNNKNDITQ